MRAFAIRSDLGQSLFSSLDVASYSDHRSHSSRSARAVLGNILALTPSKALLCSLFEDDLVHHSHILKVQYRLMLTIIQCDLVADGVSLCSL